MVGISLSIDQIQAAPPEVKRWLEIEIARTLGIRQATRTITSSLKTSNMERQVPTRPEAFAVQEGSIAQGEVKMDTIRKPTKQEEIRKLIAVRAYELWENRGRPHGCEVINWHEAEQEIMSCIEDGKEPAEQPGAQARSTDGRPPTKPAPALATSAAKRE